MSALRVVLLGILGHGKTTLFNKITQANEVTQYGGDSVTKSIVIGQAIQGEFEILDTPGFEARQDKLLHAAGVVAALSYGDVNRILVVVKFERTDIMINNLKKILAPIRRYRDITTIIISFWDDLRRNSNYKNVNLESQIKIDIEEKIKNEFNIQSFLYSQIDDDPCNITKAITNIIVRSSFTKVTLKDSEIFSQFELLSLNDESELEYNEYSRKIKQKFRKISQSFIKFIKSLSLNEPDLINKLHYISLAIKQIANEEVEKFEKQYGEYMNEFYDTDGVNIRYLHHIYLKKEIRLDLDSVIQEAQKKMKESNKHCFNWIKQCPYCGLVWIKVVGCDSETTCGNRVFCDYDELSEENSLNKYEIFVSNNTVEVKVIKYNKQPNERIQFNQEDYQKNLKILYNSICLDYTFKSYFGQFYKQDKFEELMSKVFEINNFKQVVSQMNDLNQTLCLKEIKASLQRLGTFGYFEHQNSKSLGCGKKLIWKELPPLSGPLLKELLQTELIDYFNDSDQLLKDEGYDMQKELEKTYKDLMNQVIKQQHSHIKVVPQQQTKMLKQTNQQNNQQDSIVQNYKQLIGKTKQDQSNVKKRYSVVLMIDQNQLTDIENMETCNSERFTFKK